MGGRDVLVQVVVQGVLVSLEDGELDALVGPERVEGRVELFGHGLLGANVGRRVDHLGKALSYVSTTLGWTGRRTYNVVVVLKVDVVVLHGRVNGLEGRDQVVEDGGPPCLALEALEAARVDDAHLLEDSRLAALTGTCTLVSVTRYHRVPMDMHTE